MTTRKNPFDLSAPKQKMEVKAAVPEASKKAGPIKTDSVKVAPIAIKSNNLSYDEIVKLLDGYVALPRKYWHDLRLYRKHARYIKVYENMFARGGFIVGFVESKDKKALTMTTNPEGGPKLYTWTVTLDSIQSLFVKREVLENLN